MPRRFRKGKASKAVKKYVKKAINANIETKNVSLSVNVAAGGAGTSYNGSLWSLTQIAQGDNINDRTGNVVKLRRVRITVSSTITAATIQTQLRLLVVRILQQPTNTAPLITNILATTGTDMATTSQYASGPTSNNYFQVLKDKVFNLTNQGSPIVSQTWNLTKSIQKAAVHFTGANSADYGKGHVFLVLISNMASGAGASPYTNIASQTWYKDA